MSLCINPQCTNPNNPDSNKFCQACGSELLLLGRYRVVRLLSNKGGFGYTYEAMDADTPKVLKVLINNHPHALELFRQEAEVLNQLNHPGIPKGDGFFNYFPRESDSPLACLIMEKIAGVDLEEYHRQHQFKPINQDLALNWLLQLAEILHEVHRRHFFHRDIKPSNVILKPDGQLTLIDFGAARQVTGTIMGGAQSTGIFTPGYAPPEQQIGYTVPQSDFYALGRTFVFLLTGKTPSDPSIYDFQNNQLNWRKLAGNLDLRLAEFLDELMADKVSDRPKNTEVLLQKIKALAKPKPVAKTKQQQQTKIQQTKSPQITKSPVASPSTGEANFDLRLKAAIFDNLSVAFLSLMLGELVIFKIVGVSFNWAGALVVGLISLSATTILGFFLTLLWLLVLLLPMTLIINNLENYWQATQITYLLEAIKKDYMWIAPLILGGTVKWLYFVLAEWLCKGTLGKIIYEIQVTKVTGEAISFKQANQRYWTKLLSALPLYLGFTLVFFTKRKRALHDLLSGTKVVRKSE